MIVVLAGIVERLNITNECTSFFHRIDRTCIDLNTDIRRERHNTNVNLFTSLDYMHITCTAFRPCESAYNRIKWKTLVFFTILYISIHQR